MPPPRRIARYVLRRAKRAALSPLRLALRTYVRAQPRAADLAGAERRVTILLVSAWGMGGTIRSVHNLAGYLAKTHDVEILSVFRRREEPFFKFAPGVKVTALDDQRPGATPARLRLLRNLLQGRASVLMHPADRGAEACNLWADLMLVHKLRRRAGFLIGTRPGLNLIAAELSPPGLTTIGEEQMHLGTHSRPLVWAMKRLYPRLDALAVLTERDLREYEKLLSGRREDGRPRLARIPNTVREMEGPRADLSAPVVIAAGRLTRQKGFDMLIPAFGPVAAAHPGWRLRICGSGDLHDDLQRLIEERGLSDVIELPGAQDLADEMAKASIFVLSSRFEGFPLVLLEAMSKGMAVVAFDCPTGPAEVVDDHRNGILVPAGDIDALSAGIDQLVQDEDLRRRCASAAVETARSYTMDAIGPRWDELLRELAEPGDDRAVDESYRDNPHRAIG
jgi:glycosyltransferase involved in cell wall biosynthesis